MNPSLLLLSDGRFPAGGHAHSSGLEAAVAAGRVRDLTDLEAFLRGRLATTGVVNAAFAAASRDAAVVADWMGLGDLCGATVAVGLLALLDIELDARTASPALRLASRKQGRALLRAARATWPSPIWQRFSAPVDGPHQPIALGLAAAAAGLSTEDSALASAYGTITGVASAAVRLLGFDPYHIQGLLARMVGDCATVARNVAAVAGKPPAELPCHAAPLSDIAAEVHATWEVRLFAS
jgi:urease accessory protein